VASPTTKLTKIKNILDKTGDNYNKQLGSLIDIASLYYRYVFGGDEKKIETLKTLYVLSHEDIKNIYGKIGNKYLCKDTSFIDIRSLYSVDDYCLNAGIDSIKYIMLMGHESFLSLHLKSFIITMSYNDRKKTIEDRIELLKYILDNKDEGNFKIQDYFDDCPVDKPGEQIHELSCLIQNLYNGVFPGFYTHDEIRNLLMLFTGNREAKHRDIQTVWEKFPPNIKRILPNPYLNILDLLANYYGKPLPSPFFLETS